MGLPPLVDVAKVLETQTAKDLYKDAIQPLAVQVGEIAGTLGRGANALLLPVEALIYGADKLKTKFLPDLNKKLELVPDQHLISPTIIIAGPLLESLRFTVDEPELRRMYVNLLASAMDNRVSNTVHPAFVEVVRQLTPDEALILRRVNIDEDLFLSEVMGEGNRLQDQFTQFCIDAGVANPDLAGSYLDNLIRLRIFTDVWLSDGKYMPPGGNEYGGYGPSVETTNERAVELSNFGERFLRVIA